MKPYLTPVVLLALTVTNCNIFNRHQTTRFDTRVSVLDVVVRNDTLLVAAGDSGMLLYDITKPKAPRELLRVDFGRSCRCLIAAGGAAYAGTDSGVVVYQFASGGQSSLYGGGTAQTITALAADTGRLYVATAEGITVFALDGLVPVKYLPLAGEPTGLARRDSRLFVSLRDWGVRVFNLLPGDSFALDTLQLGRHNRAEGVTLSPGGYCIISQADSGVDVYYSPVPDTVRHVGGGSGASTPTYAAAATTGVQEMSFYTADSSTVTIHKVIERPGHSSISGEMDFAEFTGFTRRICLGGNGYVYTASGDAGIYIIRE